MGGVYQGERLLSIEAAALQLRQPSSVQFAFDRNPPDAATCLEQVYRIFANYEVGPFCWTCFTESEIAAFKTKDRRQAPYDVFKRLFFEIPNCAGSLNTFKAWLPRRLELAFEDYDSFDEGLLSRFVRMGLMIWPDEEQAALRQMFCRVAIN